MPRPTPTGCTVVFDAYGTLLSNPNATRPFAQLREILERGGVNVQDYAQRAMGQRHTLSSLALSYGFDPGLDTLARLERELMEELLAIHPYQETERVLRYVMGRGAHVVVASNLAWPYALPIHTLMDVVSQRGTLVSRNKIATAFSFDVGLVKPQEEFYTRVEDSLRSQGLGRQIFMVGDRQLEDVEGPVKAGWQAWRVDRSAGAGLFDAPWDQWLG